MPIKVYITNTAGNQLTIGHQRKVKHILESNKIVYMEIDLSDPTNTDEKDFLRHQLALNNQKMSLPQIFHDEHYCCDYDGLLLAVETNQLKSILKLDQ
jgi:glutaredoxin